MNKPSASHPDTDSPHRTRDLLSVVVACYNEQEVVRETHRRIVAVLEKVPELNFEVIYVDDGSRDTTLDCLCKLHHTDPRARVIALSRNFGQQIATTAGIENAGGDAVVILDADLQDPPEVITEMLTHWRNGADIVYGVRTFRKGETLSKLWISRAFYRFMNYISDLKIPNDTGDFRLLSRKAVDAFLAMPERNRFLRGMLTWVGFRQEPVYFQRAARKAGTTKFPFRASLRLALNGVISFSIYPLRLATWIGFLTSGLALLAIIYALITRIFTDDWVPGWTFTIIIILFLGGIQLLIIGILGEYMGRIYDEVKQRPLYLVKEQLGFSTTARSAVHKSPDRSPRPASD